ncbi:unnamed protein product, partial [Ectocarpus sp. 6 AP-2014]
MNLVGRNDVGVNGYHTHPSFLCENNHAKRYVFSWDCGNPEARACVHQ